MLILVSSKGYQRIICHTILNGIPVTPPLDMGSSTYWTHTKQGSVSGANYATVNATGETTSSTTEPVSQMPNGSIQTRRRFIAAVTAPGDVLFSNTMRVANNDEQFSGPKLKKKAEFGFRFPTLYYLQSNFAWLERKLKIIFA